MSNFGSFSYFQTSLSLRVGKVLQKLPKFDINDPKLLFHCYILIRRKCPRKTPFKAQCGGPARIWREHLWTVPYQYSIRGRHNISSEFQIDVASRNGFCSELLFLLFLSSSLRKLPRLISKLEKQRGCLLT